MVQQNTDLLSLLDGKRVAVTGACGTVGAELIRQLAASGAAQITGIDHDETALFFLDEEFKQDDRVTVGLGNIRRRDSLIDAFDGADIVLHTAALKHVPLCESAPLEAVETNITGTQNVVDAAARAGVGRVLFTSTDKAVNPTNVMGTSKLMAERLVTAANWRVSDTTMCFSTRFGNVLGSRGSVLPLFARQIAQGGPVTLTDPEMTRFIMTVDDAAQLVLHSAFLGMGGEVFITKMPVARIEDLARVMVDVIAPRFDRDPAAIEIKEIGARPGEKQYEELMNDEEIRRSVDIGDFLVVEPAFLRRDKSHEGAPAEKAYNSATEDAMSADELRSYLEDSGILDQMIEEVHA